MAEGTSDIVIGSHVLEHLANAADAWKDWRRALKRGGHVLRRRSTTSHSCQLLVHSAAPWR